MQRRYVAVRGASLAGGGFSELVRRYFGEQAAFGEGSRQREKERQLCEVSEGGCSAAGDILERKDLQRGRICREGGVLELLRMRKL